MYTYDLLLAEFDEKINITERSHMVHEGLYCDGFIWINNELPHSRKLAILAEEIGHHETTVGDILNQEDMNNQKQEFKARKWAYNKLVPFEDILEAASSGCRRTYEFAEYFDLDEEFMKDCLIYYGILDISL